MGRVYCGPYALLMDSHEGYAARLLPGGTLTATWTAETDGFVAHVAACDCGWTGASRHPATEAGEDDALEEWDREHLAPLVAVAAGQMWPDWAAGVSARAREVGRHVAAGRLVLAVEAMGRLETDVARGRRAFDAVVEEASR